MKLLNFLLLKKGKVKRMKRYFIIFSTVLLICGLTGTANSIEGEFKENAGETCEWENYLHQHFNNLNNLYVEAPGVQVPPVPQIRSYLQTPIRSKHGFKSRLMVMYRLVDHLNLDEDTATRFFPAYLAHANSRDKLLKEHRELIHEISEDADDESVSVKDLKKKVAKLKIVEKSMNIEREKFLEKSEEILDERQYIKLIVFNDKLKEDLISRFRSERMLKSTKDRLKKNIGVMKETEKKRNMREKDK